MIEFVVTAIGVGLGTAFFILFITKIGWREKVIVHGFRLISKLFECDFCLSFWIGFGISGSMVLITGNPLLFLIPILSTPLTRVLL